MHLLDAGVLIADALLALLCMAQSWVGEYHDESFLFSTPILTALSLHPLLHALLQSLVSLPAWPLLLLRLGLTGALIFFISWLCYSSYEAAQYISGATGFGFGVLAMCLMHASAPSGLLVLLLCLACAATGALLVRLVESPAVLLGSSLLGSAYFANVWAVQVTAWMQEEYQRSDVLFYQRLLFYTFLSTALLSQACLRNYRKHDRDDLSDVIPFEFFELPSPPKAEV